MATELTCEQARAWMEAAEVGELGPVERARLAAHLRRCLACARATAWEATLHQAVRDWPTPPPRRDLVALVHARLSERQVEAKRAWMEWGAWWMGLVSLAAALGLGSRWVSWEPVGFGIRWVRAWVAATAADLQAGGASLWETARWLARLVAVGWDRWQAATDPLGLLWVTALALLLIGQAWGWWWTGRQLRELHQT